MHTGFCRIFATYYPHRHIIGTYYITITSVGANFDFHIRKHYAFHFSCVANSRSASDNIRTIIEKTESVYVQKFQCLINGTLCSGKFSKSLANEQEPVGAYFASGFIDQ